MGPLAFVLYTGPLSEVIAAHRHISHMLHADDTQLYVVIKRNHLAGSLSSMEDCVRDIKAWARGNNMILNENKTEVVHIVSQFRKRIESVSLTIDGAVINASKSARDLGVIVDDSLDVKEHIRKVCRAASSGIYRIRKIRKYLNQSSTERLFNALVTSHLDYCNSVLRSTYLPVISLHFSTYRTLLLVLSLVLGSMIASPLSSAICTGC
ncbi:uncharacterized protein [Diadema antillarum]|uniref:uncharacterized protein n=1 Tax=Diadema antillarum TaxID=105358 RepID=UPI003A8A61C5